MKKSFSVFFATILISIFTINKNIKTNVGFCASDIINSPSLKRSFERYFLNEGSIAMTYCPVGETGHCNLKFDDGMVHCQFKDIPQARKKELVKERCFAVLLDGVKGPIDYQFLEKKDGVNGECSFNIPINSDCLEIHIYGQGENDPDFLLREENFLCKSKFFSTYVTLAYLKKIENCVEYYDRDGVLLPEVKLPIYQSGIPNIYAIDVGPEYGLMHRMWGVKQEYVIGLLDLPDGKNSLVNFEDRIFPIAFLGIKFPDESSGDSMLPHYRFYLYVKVPQGVTKFSVKAYEQNIFPCFSEYEGSDHDKCYLGEFKVDLNKKQ